MADKNGAAQAHGGATADSRSRAARIASRGIRTGEDLANTASALVTDVLNNDIELKTARCAVSAGNLLVNVSNHNVKHGSDRVIATDPTGDDRRHTIQHKKAELEAQLRALCDAEASMA